MINILKVSFLFLMGGSACIFLSNASGAGNAQGADRTGSPIGIGTCGSCHDGGNFSPVINVSLLEGDQQVTRYIPGKLYQIKVTIEGKNNPKEYGFQLVALSGSNHQQAGNFGQAPAGFRQIILDNRKYIEQSSPRTTNSFLIPWTAPSSGTGVVRFYASGLVTNNNNGTGGDSPIHLTTPVSVSESVSSFISTIPELKVNVNIYPNPVSTVFQIQGLSLPVGKLIFQVVDIFGRVHWETENQIIDSNLMLHINANDWFPGVYFLKITDNKAIKTVTFVKN
ncbi:MAG: hypothetical protein RLZZ417_1760 [Bacteroidota bacterium]|jgi:hypothetical protein